jgi:hypothetical protein
MKTSDALPVTSDEPKHVPRSSLVTCPSSLSRSLSFAIFSAALRRGYWFCVHCDRVVLDIPEIAVDVFNENHASCPHCHKRACTWHPPVLSNAETLKSETLKSAAVTMAFFSISAFQHFSFYP